MSRGNTVLDRGLVDETVIVIQPSDRVASDSSKEFCSISLVSGD